MGIHLPNSSDVDIVLKRDIFGYYLKLNSIPTSIDTIVKDPFIFTLTFILLYKDNRKEEYERLKKYIVKLPQSYHMILSVLMTIPSKTMDEGELTHFFHTQLKNWPKEKTNAYLQNVLHLFHLKRRTDDGLFFRDKFLKSMREAKNKSQKEYSIWNELNVEDNRKIVQNRYDTKEIDLFRIFYTSHLAWRVQNAAWAKKEVIKMLNGDGLQFYFSSFFPNVDPIVKSGFYQNIYDWVNLIIEMDGGKSLAPYLLLFLKSNDNQFNLGKYELKGESVENGFNNRSYIASMTNVNWGGHFPGVWISFFGHRSAQREWDEYLNHHEVEVVSMLQDHPWFMEYFSAHFIKKQRELIQKILRTLNNSDDLYHYYLLLRLNKNPIYHNLLKLIDIKWERLAFHLEREFYHKCLVHGRAIDLSVFQLYKIGDVNPDVLWWLAL